MAVFGRFNIKLVAAGAWLCVIAISLSAGAAAAPPVGGGSECFEGKGEVCTASAALADMAGVPMALPGPVPVAPALPVVPAAPRRAGGSRGPARAGGARGSGRARGAGGRARTSGRAIDGRRWAHRNGGPWG